LDGYIREKGEVCKMKIHAVWSIYCPKNERLQKFKECKLCEFFDYEALKMYIVECKFGED
jgi:hypothetical protein